jgi:hypothetical protein
MMQQMRGRMGQPQAPGAAGPPPGGGYGQMMQQMQGRGGGRPGVPGAPGVPGGGTGSPDGGDTGAGPGYGQPGSPEGQQPPTNAYVSLSRVSNIYLVAVIDLPLEDDKQKRRNVDLTENLSIRVKGMAEMANLRPRWPELAATVKNLPGGLPRGTVERQGTAGRPLAPKDRLSFFVDLLPMLDDGREIVHRIKRNEGWRSPDNLAAGAFLVPSFLDPSYPRDSFQTGFPSVPGRSLGATHYVGMAGVGPDAASYGPDDHKEKQGMLGYNRQLKLADVSDGLANTIYMIQVPPNPQRAWIAGGGTLQGVPEQGSIKPFVHTHGGKRGTHVLMGDGSVRFLNENISDEVMKALATARGGESVSSESAGERVAEPRDTGPARPPARK